MSHRITIVIPTYERTRYLTRALQYWSVYPVNIIVVDGSKEPSISNEQVRLSENIQYYHLPISVEKRLSFAASKLTSDYAVLSPDDEFLSYAALVEGANILDSHQEVSAVLGETLGFVTLGKEFLFKSHYKDARLLDISSRDPRERYVQRKNASDSIIFYSLVRSETLRLACSFIAEYEYACPYVAELQMEAMFCAAGTVVAMPMVMWFRNFGVPAISSKQYNRRISFLDWVRDPRNTVDIERLKASASEYFAKASPAINPLTGAQFLELNVTKSVEELLPEQMYLILKIRKLYFLSPASFKRLVRAVLIFIFGKTPSGLQSISKMLDELSATGVGFEMNEIVRIQDLTLPSE